MSLVVIFYIVAFVLAIAACFGISNPRLSLGWGSVAFIALGLLASSGGLR